MLYLMQVINKTSVPSAECFFQCSSDEPQDLRIQRLSKSTCLPGKGGGKQTKILWDTLGHPTENYKLHEIDECNNGTSTVLGS